MKSFLHFQAEHGAVLCAHDAAVVLGVSRVTVLALARSGALPKIVSHGRTYFPYGALLAIAYSRIPATSRFLPGSPQPELFS